MLIHHRRSFFPVVISILTLALILLMAYAFSGREVQPENQARTEEVSAQEYLPKLISRIANFQSSYVSSADVSEKTAVVNLLISDILEMTVPSQYKELHLGVVIKLYVLREALSSGEAFDDEQARLDEINNLPGAYVTN